MPPTVCVCVCVRDNSNTESHIAFVVCFYIHSFTRSVTFERATTLHNACDAKKTIAIQLELKSHISRALIPIFFPVVKILYFFEYFFFFFVLFALRIRVYFEHFLRSSGRWFTFSRIVKSVLCIVSYRIVQKRDRTRLLVRTDRRRESEARGKVAKVLNGENAASLPKSHRHYSTLIHHLSLHDRYSVSTKN